MPTAQTIVSFITNPSPVPAPVPGRYAYGSVPYADVTAASARLLARRDGRADRVRRGRREARLPPPGRARRALWTAPGPVDNSATRTSDRPGP
ncbi:hypothetical protein GCM10010129_12020 [Streptomyces fumigatiscleroticus]|nr:hypothetical protein GCM10010129_12020 [Streptomyces fumigatiscleroticus]